MVIQVERIARQMARASWISFWIQVVLGVIASVILIFASPTLITRTRTAMGTVDVAPNPGAASGFALAAIALIVLAVSIYQAFLNTKHARRLQAPKGNRPSRADTIRRLRLGVMVNLFGLGVALVGAESITGQLIGKALMQSNPFNVGMFDPSKFVQALDILVVLGNTHGMFAHFCSLAISLWLIDRISKASQSD